MATLSGNKIKNTYQSLVKFSDNGNITTSAKQLTEEEVREIGMDWGSFTEGETSIVEDDNYPKCKVFFNGIEYGDDTQTEVEGDTLD